jgi:hypothetical protein
MAHWLLPLQLAPALHAQLPAQLTAHDPLRQVIWPPQA